MKKLAIPELLKDCSDYNCITMKYGFTEGVPDSLNLIADVFADGLVPLQISRGSNKLGEKTLGGFVQIYRRYIV